MTTTTRVDELQGVRDAYEKKTADLTALEAADPPDADAIGTLQGELDGIQADTEDLQTQIGTAGAGLTAIPATVDWLNGGRLDLILDAILVDTAVIGAAGAGLTAIPATVDWLDGGRLDLLLDSILSDTGELQTDWANGGRLDLLIDSILADTGELQTDWANGGRLDLIIDAILVDTSTTLQNELDGIQADTEDIQNRLPASLVSGRMSSDMVAISGDTGAADALEALMDGVQEFTVNDAAATITAFAADGFTATAVDDVYNGRLITFLTGANVFEQTDITGYDHTGGTQGEQEFTVTALTAAPANNVIGIIH